MKYDPADTVQSRTWDGKIYTYSEADLAEHGLSNVRNDIRGLPGDDGTGNHAGSIDAENSRRARSGESEFFRANTTTVTVNARPPENPNLCPSSNGANPSC